MFSKPIRVSPAMGVALVALAFAVSGTSLAQGAATKIGRLISGSSIKKGSIPGSRLTKGGVTADRIKSNSLTGKQINEKTLTTVPSATEAQRAQSAATSTNAQRATNADNALALGGTAAAGFLTFATRTIPSGITVTGAFGISSNVTNGVTANVREVREVVQLPGLAPADLTDETVNFANASGANDIDSSCTGSAAAPTAPAGKVCLYGTAAEGIGTTFDGQAIPGLPGSRAGFVVHAASADAAPAAGVFGTWAYTAP
ncbi:MAG TPA: hypothetical protein VFD90_02695 [Gaiellales bacterium]|nr:hypothetical protein [Gaiellales bacterium]